MKRLAIALLLLVASAAAFVYASLPAPAVPLAPAPAEAIPSVRGALHVHTTRSDGTGSLDQIAAAAARAGLKFVVFTDHGDAAREPDPPLYRSGVLCIDGVEISTDGGHVLALGMPRSPYRLAGEARDVVEDIARLGGMSIAAHPGSEKPQLRWVEWTAPFNGIEWLNGDSEWRDEPRGNLARAVMTFPFRPVGSLSAILDRPESIMRRWDVLTGRRQVVAVAAADAHARVSLRGSSDEYDSVGVLHMPSYEHMFRSFSITAVDVRLSGEAGADARAVIDALRRGHVFSSIDALASPAAMAFSAVRGTLRASAGDVVPIGAGELTLSLDSNAPPGAQIVLWKSGQPISTVAGPAHRWTADGKERAAYRVEITLPEAPGAPPVPWAVSNPIYVGNPADATVAPRTRASDFAPQYENGFATDWTVETSPRSKAALDVVPALGGTQLSMRWALGGTLSESPYAALVMPAGPAFSGYDRLMFTARASIPMRISVQIRVPSGTQGERWHRSVFVDEAGRDATVFFDDMTPRGSTVQRRPVLANVRDVLFVVDTVNTKPGTAGQIWIDDVKYGR
jgi:hypothetical protein